MALSPEINTIIEQIEIAHSKSFGLLCDVRRHSAAFRLKHEGAQALFNVAKASEQIDHIVGGIIGHADALHAAHAAAKSVGDKQRATRALNAISALQGHSREASETAARIERDGR